MSANEKRVTKERRNRDNHTQPDPLSSLTSHHFIFGAEVFHTNQPAAVGNLFRILYLTNVLNTNSAPQSRFNKLQSFIKLTGVFKPSSERILSPAFVLHHFKIQFIMFVFKVNKGTDKQHENLVYFIPVKQVHEKRQAFRIRHQCYSKRLCVCVCEQEQGIETGRGAGWVII